jgi:NADH:ubiquinone oxidoreductase subunit 5 (subunit L)/multisubunit Na+/H+ antiporter MnhA subunit
VGTTAAVVSAVYSVKVAWYAWRPAAHADDARDTAAGRVGPAASGALILLAIAAVALGAFALPPAERTLRRILGVEGEILPGAWQLVVSAAVALVAASVTWWWGGRSIAVPAWLRRVATEWLFLQRAAHLLIVDPTLRSARFLAVVDDRVVDQAVRGVARAGLAAARTARRVDDVRVDGVVTGIAAGARRCGHLARRLQTGLVHQYYAQAATGIAALILLVVVVR